MPLSPRFQFSRQRRTSSLVVPGFKPHERVRKVVVGLVVLRREIIGLGLAASADELRPARRSGACDAGIGPMLSKNLQSRFQPLSRSITAAPSSRSPSASTASFSRNARAVLAGERS